MEQYVGLGVSLKETSVCVVDALGEIVCEGKVSTTPEAIAKFVRKKALHVARIGLESGLLSNWLCRRRNPATHSHTEKVQ